MRDYISQQELEKKVKTLIEMDNRLLNCYSDFHFEDSLIRLPIETQDGYVFEATFCYGYQHKKYLVALSPQIGCATKCKFCDLGDYGFKRNLTGEELLEEMQIVLDKAMKRGYNIFDRPIKVTFVMGGEPLANNYFADAMERIKEAAPLQMKISTIFPAAKKNLDTYNDIVRVAKDYPNIVQFQVSLNSTDETYRQYLAGIPLADFKTVREAGEKWHNEVPNPRKVDLTFTLNHDSPMNPEDIKEILPPDLFTIRLRACLPTERGKRYGIEKILEKEIDDVKQKFTDVGYDLIPGMPGEVEWKFKLAPGEILRVYDKIRTDNKQRGI